jgi:hypothetical protein
LGLRFYRRVRLFPGVDVNFSRSGPSLTLGVRGAHVTSGDVATRTVGLPGTGIYYTSRNGYHSGYRSAHSDVALNPQAQAAANRRAELTLVVVGLGVALVIIVLMAL